MQTSHATLQHFCSFFSPAFTAKLNRKNANKTSKVQKTTDQQQMFDHGFFFSLLSLFMYARVHLDSPIKQVYGSLSAPPYT